MNAKEMEKAHTIHARVRIFAIIKTFLGESTIPKRRV